MRKTKKKQKTARSNMELKKLSSYIFFLIPIIVINIYSEPQFSPSVIQQESGMIIHSALSSISLVLLFFILEKVSKKIISKSQESSSRTTILDPNAIAAVSVTWILLMSIVGYDIIAARTSYTRWINGTSNANTLIEAISDENIKQTKIKLEISKKVAKNEIESEKIIALTRKLEKQVDSIDGCLKLCHKSN
jgi:hypothetical protein